MMKYEVRSTKYGTQGVARPSGRSYFTLRTSYFRSRPAFTLIEAITTLVIIALIGVAASRVLFQAFQALDNAATRTDLANQVASAMERVASEVRTIQIESASNPPVPDITACTASSITFKNTSGATRTLTLTGSTLVLTGSAAATQTLASGVTTFTIQTYNGSNAALPASPSAAQIDSIRRIQFTITASVTNTNATISETLRTKVFVRCMGLGSGSS